MLLRGIDLDVVKSQSAEAFFNFKQVWKHMNEKKS